MSSNLVFIVSSASGVGKTTLCNMLKKKYSEIEVSVSATTRKKRDHEKENIDYFFVDNDAFARMVKENKFVEHALVYGNQYGTLRSELDRIASKEKISLFDIDWQGVKQIKKTLKDFLLVTVYLLPPSIEAVYNRLSQRNTDSKEIINKRMELVYEDIKHAKEYDYVIVNDNLEESFAKLCSVYEAAKIRNNTLRNTEKLTHQLLSEKVEKR